MSLTPDQVQDFVTLTLSHFKKRKWSDISLDLQDYVASSFITKKALSESGGKDISFRLQVRNTGTAVNTGLYAQDVTAVEDLMISASAPWAKQSVNWSYDIDEPLFQSDAETIISELQVREHSAYNDMAELNEQNLWSAPASSADTRPMGIPFWLQSSSSAGDGGFLGGNPSGAGFNGCAGVDSTTYPNWRNWAFSYSSVTTDDLVKKLKRSIVKTRFKPPHRHPELGYGSSQYRIYTNYDGVVEPLERLAETRNENLGSDVARYMNQVTVGGVPISYVHYLDENDSTGLLYGICWKHFRPFVKKGANMRRSKPMPAPNQHTVRRHFIDTWMNYICYNRRSQFVGRLAA